MTDSLCQLERADEPLFPASKQPVDFVLGVSLEVERRVVRVPVAEGHERLFGVEVDFAELAILEVEAFDEVLKV